MKLKFVLLINLHPGLKKVLELTKGTLNLNKEFKLKLYMK